MNIIKYDDVIKYDSIFASSDQSIMTKITSRDEYNNNTNTLKAHDYEITIRKNL